MGSFNNHPEAETNPVKNQQKEPPVYCLTNSIYYFIESVLILMEEDHFRLLALHHNRVLHDSTYKTLKACKIAFGRLFKNKTWREDIVQHWSPGYNPEQNWLKKKGYESCREQGAGRMGERE